MTTHGSGGAHAFGLAPGEAVLVITPHPDGETLGAGGTLARLAHEGIEVHVLAVRARADRQDGGHGDPGERLRRFGSACGALGVTAAAIAWPDERSDLSIGRYPRELIALIEEHPAVSLDAVNPAALLIPSASAFHHDHQAVHHAAFAAARIRAASLKPAPRIVAGFRGAEDVWTAHREPWRVHVDTSRHWTAKEAALRCYTSPAGGNGHRRRIDQIRAADAAAGEALGLGCQYAEIFVPYRLAY